MRMTSRATHASVSSTLLSTVIGHSCTTRYTKVLVYTSITFLRKLKEKCDGLLPFVIKTGRRTSIRGFAVFILCLEPIPYHLITYHQYSVIPRAQ